MTKNLGTTGNIIEDFDLFLKEVRKSAETKIVGREFAGMGKDDVIQEVLIKVHKSLSVYDPTKSKVSTYVDRVMTNTIKDCFKKCAAEKNLSLVNALEIEDTHDRTTDLPQPYSVHIGKNEVGYLKVELSIIKSQLCQSERENEIFELRTQGYEFVEIAEMYGVSKARISQIWKEIKNRYDML